MCVTDRLWKFEFRRHGNFHSDHMTVWVPKECIPPRGIEPTDPLCSLMQEKNYNYYTIDLTISYPFNHTQPAATGSA